MLLAKWLFPGCEAWSEGAVTVSSQFEEEWSIEKSIFSMNPISSALMDV